MPQLPITIRKANTADIPVILRYRRGMYVDMGYADEVAFDAMMKTSAPCLEQGMSGGTFHAWIAERAIVESSAGQPVACGAVTVVPWPSSPREAQCRRATILNVYTEREYRKQGIATRLIEAMIAWCRSEGLAFVSLHASEDGRHLYESMGFKPTNEMRLNLK